MKRIIWLSAFIVFLVIFLTCKKKSEDPADNPGWSKEDQAYYHNVISLQDTAYKKYHSWSRTMSKQEALNMVQQFFENDPSVSFAVIGSQGVAVQYSNGMRGGIFLNPLDIPEIKSGRKGLKIESAPAIQKSPVTTKKMILLDPHYWDRKEYTDNMVTGYNQDLPAVGFNLETVFDEQASVDRFFELDGYGIIQIYSHGWAWPSESNITDVFVMTGEPENESTSEKYWNDIKAGSIEIAPALVEINGIDSVYENVYFISGGMFESKNQNNFSNDTILFYGGFCWSFLGHWPYIPQTFADGAYFGFNWSVYTDASCDWANSLINDMADISLDKPVTTEDWMNDPTPEKSYYYEKDDVTVDILYNGASDLTLWKKESPCDGFPPIGESWLFLDADHVWMLMLTIEGVSELIDGKEVYRRRIATDPPGIGGYFACDPVLGHVEVAEDNALPPYDRDFFSPPKPFVLYGSTIGSILSWQGMHGTSPSEESYEVVKYQNVSVPFGNFVNTMVVKDKWYLDGYLIDEEYYWIDKKIGLVKLVTIGETDTLYLNSYTPPLSKGKTGHFGGIDGHLLWNRRNK